MKIKNAVFCLIALLLSGNVLAMMRMPDTPEGRRALWMQKQQEIDQLQEDLVVAQQAFDALPGKGEVDVDPNDIRADIQKVKAEVGAILKVAGQAEDEWVENREKNKPVRTPRDASSDVELEELEDLTPDDRPMDFGAGVLETAGEREYMYNNLMRTASENDKEIQGPLLLARAWEAGDEWVKYIDTRPRQATPPPEWGGAGEPPLPSPPQSSSSWITPKRGALAAGIVILGYAFQKAPEWMKNRVKRILKEHGKKISDLDPAEQDLLISASYARFNPVGSFFFQEAVLDMPEDADLRDQFWPILNHVYYGKKRVTRKQARELRKLYDEAKELMIAD